jgi:hypothetical protein
MKLTTIRSIITHPGPSDGRTLTLLATIQILGERHHGPNREDVR